VITKVRTLPLDFSPANGRNPCSPRIDRRHAKVWISMRQLPLTQPRSQPRELMLGLAVAGPRIISRD
jgi:hypothetical protein